jgi:hypothetical protein
MLVLSFAIITVSGNVCFYHLSWSSSVALLPFRTHLPREWLSPPRELLERCVAPLGFDEVHWGIQKVTLHSGNC